MAISGGIRIEADDINDLGQIVGSARNGGLSLTVHNTTDLVLYGQFSVWADTWAPAVPEPQALFSMLCGLAVLGAAARGHKCAAALART